MQHTYTHTHTLAHTQIFRYSSWMGGDRDGNPNVTSDVTAHVVYLARWMAADLYYKEVDALHFEVGVPVGEGGCTLPAARRG
jgi:phosphoenolpyruvate carboxylase